MDQDYERVFHALINWVPPEDLHLAAGDIVKLIEETRSACAAQLEQRALELGQKMSSAEEGGIAHIGCGAAAHELLAQAAVMRAL